MDRIASTLTVALLACACGDRGPSTDAAVTSAGGESGQGGTPMDTGGSAGTAPAGGGVSGAVDPGPAVLIHRYDFSGQGTRVLDLVGGGDGELMGGAELDGDGFIELDGVDDYVDLPNGLISSLPSVSIMLWVEWHGARPDGGECWQRLFDFGTSSAGEGLSGSAVHSVFLAPWGWSCGDYPAMVLMNESTEYRHTLLMDPLVADEPVAVAVVLDGVGQRAAVYVDGALATPADPQAFPRQPSATPDLNCWLGRSQWEQDHDYLFARLDEFRVYQGVLAPAEVQDLSERGPNQP